MPCFEQDGLEISGYLYTQLGSILHDGSHLIITLGTANGVISCISFALRKPAQTQAGHREVDGAGQEVLDVFWIWIFLLSQRHNSLWVNFRFRNPFTATATTTGFKPRPTIPDITPCYYQKAMKCIYDAAGNQQKRTTFIPRQVARRKANTTQNSPGWESEFSTGDAKPHFTPGHVGLFLH